MIEILEITFRSFWHFVGVLILLGCAGKLVFLIWNRFMRMLNIRKHGWPPPHCDADGDFFSEDSREEETTDIKVPIRCRNN